MRGTVGAWASPTAVNTLKGEDIGVERARQYSEAAGDLWAYAGDDGPRGRDRVVRLHDRLVCDGCGRG